jgi:hypothetical protein
VSKVISITRKTTTKSWVQDELPLEQTWTWACRDCGAGTNNPEHRLIEYFHLGCKSVS